MAPAAFCHIPGRWGLQYLQPMDFPPFYIDHIAGGRLIIGLIATLHVLINHPLAVGAYPLLTLMEWWGVRTRNKALDELAYKITFVVFIITTTVGALTGVGIWLTTSLFEPFAIGSLLRVFFWGWFSEWIVFVSEVLLIMAYFLTWKKWITPEMKRRHIQVGIALSIMSWLTMMLIVAVLGFMMRPGQWTQLHTFWSAFFNPLYFPQLAFRTAFSMVTGALFIWFASFFFTKADPDLREFLVWRLSHWVMIWLIGLYLAGLWYWRCVPDAMKANNAVALLSQQFADWHEMFLSLLGWTIAAFFLIAFVGLGAPRLVPRYALLIPTFMGIWLLGHFERAREFMRKPWIIGDYLYSNGIHKDEVEFFKTEGLLKYATYVKYHTVTPDNMVEAGSDVFMIACSRCHSTTGMNGVVEKFTHMYGNGPWDKDAMFNFLEAMHETRTFMPPFPGNESEAKALVAFIIHERATREPLAGVQSGGIQSPAPVLPKVAAVITSNSDHAQ